MTTEAEESPFLKFVTRKVLVKAAREDLACALVIAKCVDSDSAVIACSSKSCV
jgi:hypothetical protein